MVVDDVPFERLYDGPPSPSPMEIAVRDGLGGPSYRWIHDHDNT